MTLPPRVGTCGYSYFWNEGKPSPFEWYLGQGFNTVEVNASFYRFPSPSWTRVWLRAPGDFDFSIKVHRSITHYRRLGEGCPELFERFRRPLEPLRERIAFWLFQMPPTFTYKERNAAKLASFLSALGLASSAVLEFRHPSWWEHVGEVMETEAAFCSVDAPGLPRDLIAVNDVLYLRIHGRTSWYSHVYSEEELEGIASGVVRSDADRKYVYLNNDEGMLSNGSFLMRRFGLKVGVQRTID